jgi:hypothetical protein
MEASHVFGRKPCLWLLCQNNTNWYIHSFLKKSLANMNGLPTKLQPPTIPFKGDNPFQKVEGAEPAGTPEGKCPREFGGAVVRGSAFHL